MPSFLPDTSCMVAAVCAWHEHHDRAARAIERRLDEGQAMVLAAAALVETYAVLTRLPPRHRLSPADTWALLEANFVGEAAQTVALDAATYHDLLRNGPERDIAGGLMYDAVIVACARTARVEEILTFNERQFRLLAPQGIDIVVPA